MNWDREEPRRYRPSSASPEGVVEEEKDREEREGAMSSEALVMSMKREGPSVAEQSRNVATEMVNVGVPERIRWTAPPFDALHRVNIVDREMANVEVTVPDIAAPFPPVYVRSVKAHAEILADAPELIETAEVDIITGEFAVADATEMLAILTLPLSTLTIGQGAFSVKAMFAIVFAEEEESVWMMKSAEDPLTLNVPTLFVGVQRREGFR